MSRFWWSDFPFIYIARGSSGEVRSMLRVKLRRERPAPVRKAMEEMIACAMSCSRQLRGWADSLQNSDIMGQRHLNNRTRRDYDQKKGAAEFDKTVLRQLPAWHPKRKEAEERGQI